MASPQPPYTTPGYYTQYSYGSPGGYHPQYPQHPPPHHMNGHAPMHSQPRMNGPGPSNGRGYHPNRGAPPGYHNYNQVPPQHYMHAPNAATPSPPPISPTYSHQHKSHPAHAPYQHYAAPPNVAYPVGWSAEPLSPLPKQLSMLTPLPSQIPPNAQPPPPTEPVEPPSEPPPEPTPPSPERVSSPLRFEQREILGTPTDSEDALAPTLPTENSAVIYAIWSRRPHDPSSAPAIIISPRARPPQNVIEEALDLPTPPITPIPFVEKTVPEGDAGADSGENTSIIPPVNVEIPSSSAMETTPASSTVPDTPVPEQSVSSITSGSVSATEPKAPTISSPKVDSGALQEAPTIASAPAPAPTSSAPAVKKSWASLLRTDGSSSTSNKSANALPTSSVVGFSIPGDNPSPNVALLPGKKQDILVLLTSGPTGPGTVPRIRPRGLVNSGNMCFANAVLQVLIYCQPFYRLFTELGKYLPGPVVGSSKRPEGKTPLVDAAIQFLAEFNPRSPKEKRRGEEEEEDDGLDSFMPVGVYDAMKEKKRFDNMRGGHQEDAEEFLGFYLDTLEDELLHILDSLTPPTRPEKAEEPVEEFEKEEAPRDDGWLEVGRQNRSVVTRTTKTTESPITRIFGGSFRSTLRVPNQKDSAVVEMWRSLQLDIQREQVHTISEALQGISHPQSVQVTSQTRPGVTVDASQQVLIETLPPILVLHLKRFLYDTKVGGVVKIGKPISFTPELDIDPELITPRRRTAQRVKYKLIGVLYHHGLSASGGHYTLDVLHPNRDLTAKPREGWIRIDDELVSDVLPKDVFNDIDADHRCPYLLFYRRVNGAWSSASRT